jgi:hypothetical protein
LKQQIRHLVGHGDGGVMWGRQLPIAPERAAQGHLSMLVEPRVWKLQTTNVGARHFLGEQTCSAGPVPWTIDLLFPF